MIFDALAKSIELEKLVGMLETGASTKVVDDFVDCDGELLKRAVIDELGETIKWQLSVSFSMRQKEEK